MKGLFWEKTSTNCHVFVKIIGAIIFQKEKGVNLKTDWSQQINTKITQMLYLSLIVSPFFPPIILLLIGIISFMLYLKWDKDLLWRLPESIFLGFMGVTVVSWYLEPSWFYGLPVGLIVLFAFTLYYFLTHWVRSALNWDWTDVQQIYLMFWVSGLYVAAIVFLQQLEWPALKQTFIGSLLDFYKEFSWQSESARSIGTTGNSNLTAAMLICFALMSIYASTILPKIWQKIGAYGFFVIYVLAIWLTGSRGAWVGLVIGLVVQVWMTGHRKWTLALLFILVNLVVFFPELIPRKDTLMYTLKDRIHIWKTTVSIFEDNWLFGALPLHFGQVFQSKAGFHVYHAHNIVLGIAAEFGIIGLILFITLVFFTLKRARRWRKTANKREEKRLAGMLLSQTVALISHGMYDYPILSPQVGVLFMLSVIIIHTQYERRCLSRPTWSQSYKEEKIEGKEEDLKLKKVTAITLIKK